MSDQQTDENGLTAKQAELLNGDPLHMTIFRRMEELFDSADEIGIYRTTEFMAGLKQDILDLYGGVDPAP